MAKFSNGFMGPFSGKLGPAVGYTWNGKWCMRSYQKYVKNPRTEAQQAHRAMFKQEVQLAARMRQVIARTMTDPARELGMTAYNLFVKANQAAFAYTDDTLVVDYPNLVLSFGDIAPVEAESLERTADNVLNVRFARGVGRGNDEVYLYVWVPDLQRGYMSSSVHRREKRLSVALPDEYAAHAIQAWLLVQGEEGGWSDSAYCGVLEACRRRIEVVAAIIDDGEGRVFATQRGYGDWKDFWEFPGGKMESGETPEEALRREIWEELETRVEVGGLVKTVEWDYPDFHLTMHCYRCRVESGSLTLKEHEAARWLGKAELESVDWLPADQEVINILKQ